MLLGVSRKGIFSFFKVKLCPFFCFVDAFDFFFLIEFGDRCLFNDVFF